MHTIGVASLPLNEVINDIASAFKTTSAQDNGEQILYLPPEIGSGTIRGINFDGGLGIIQYQCTFNEDTEIQFTVNKIHPLKFIYIIDGELNHRFENEKQVHIVYKFQNAIVSSSDKNGHVLSFKKGVKTNIYSLEIDRNQFCLKTTFLNEGLHDKLKKLFEDEEADTSFYYEGEYSLRMADIFKRIEEFSGRGFLYMIFMESIAYQTLVQQLSQYLDDQEEEKNRSVLRQSEIEKISIAANYILAHLPTYKSMPTLTKVTGLNASKLQEGFKYLYNRTVNQYVHESRMNLAKELLISTDISISEIVYKIGLSSKSYFSRVFREEYGISPSTFRRKQQR